jgi:hypothetical protein
LVIGAGRCCRAMGEGIQAHLSFTKTSGHEGMYFICVVFLLYGRQGTDKGRSL